MEDSDDDLIFEQVCQIVNTNMDSVILRYPNLWGLPDLPERNSDYYEVVLSYSPDDFRGQFQMSRPCFEDLMTKLASTSKIRNMQKKLFFTLWMLSSQDSYESVGSRFSYSKSTAHLNFNEILNAILLQFADYVIWPSANEYPEISQAFKDKSGGYIPGIVGAIDACHLIIKAPKENAEDYENDKGSHSIILQAICDHRMIFTDVYVGSPGSLSNGTVFRESNIYKQLDKIVSGEYHLVGDTAYPLMRNLITPFRDTGNLSESKTRFNTLLSSPGLTINRALSILKGRFQKLRYLDTPNPEVANKIVCSCITLHNHIRMFDVDEDDQEFADDPIFPIVYIDDGETRKERTDKKNAGYIKRNYLVSLCE